MIRPFIGDAYFRLTYQPADLAIGLLRMTHLLLAQRAIPGRYRELRRLGIDAERVALVGDSAGGNLMAVTAIRARDAGLPLAAQVLIYPVIDKRCQGASKTECAEGYLISKAAVDWFWDHYLATPADIESPLASPLNAKSLAGLAPALILTAEYDPSRDEAIEYFTALQAAGNDCQHVPLPGLIHGAFWMSGAVPRAAEVLVALGEFLARRLGKKN